MERDGLCMWSSGDSINFGQLSWSPPPTSRLFVLYLQHCGAIREVVL